MALAPCLYEQLDHPLEIVHAELLPEDKARIITEFKEEGLTAMIGDGVNDAPALATADIGISMGISGSALATETGQVILMSNDIRKIPEAIRLARKAHRKVIVNILLSITTKSAILALGFAGHPLVWAAVLADVGTCLLVILNSMLLLRGTEKPRGMTSKCHGAHHAQKRGCSDRNGSSSHDHHVQDSHHRCCSDSKTHSVHQPQKPHSGKCAAKCQSHPPNSNSCGDKKCMDSAQSHDGCRNSDEFHKDRHCHHAGSHHMVNHCLESNKMHNHGCSVPHTLNPHTQDKCSNSIGRKGEEDGPRETKHCNHSPPPLEESQKMTNHDQHCHSTNCGKSHDENHIGNGEAGKLVESSCNHHHPIPRAHPDSDNCGKDCNVPLHTTIDIVPCTQHVESITEHALEKRETGGCCKGHSEECIESLARHPPISNMEHREIGGCCKSYMKECCHKHGQLGASFGGGLSEIVTE